MSKITLTNLANLQNDTTAVAAINANSAAVTTAMNNTLSRDGTYPNQMGASLDMNSNHILNLPTPENELEPLRKKDLNDFLGVDFQAVLDAEAIAVAAAAAAAASEATVETLAEGVPVVAVYATKALANAALAGLAANSVIEVTSDESRSGDRDRYKKVAGVYVYLYSLPIVLADGSYVFFDRDFKTRYRVTLEMGEWVPRIWPHIYLDTVSGNDSNDGFTAPFKTVTKVKTHSAYGTGMTLGVKRGDPTLIRDEMDLAGADYVTITSYGTGALPIFDGTDIALNASFSANGTFPATCHDITWAHSMVGTSDPKVRVFEDGIPLKRTASLAACNAAAGTYFYSSDPSTTSPLVVTVQARDSSNPASNGKLYEITKRYYAVAANSHSWLQGLYGRRTGGHNGAFRLFTNGKANCLLSEEGTTHNCVFGDGKFHDVINVNWTSDEFADGGVATAFFVVDAAGLEVYAERCASIVDPTVYGSVITTGNNAVTNANTVYLTHDLSGHKYNKITMKDCWTYGVVSGNELSSDNIVIDNFYTEGTYRSNSGAWSFGNSASATITGGLSVGPERLVDLPGTLVLDRHVFIGDSISGAVIRANNTNDDITVTNCGIFLTTNNETFLTRAPFTGNFKLTMKDNYIYAPRVPMAFNGASFTYDVDRNYYENREGPGGMKISINGVDTSYPDWQALGNDANSIQSDATLATAWASGNPPLVSRIDTRLRYDNPATTLTHFDVPSWTDSPNVPKTRAAAITYLATAPTVAVQAP